MDKNTLGHSYVIPPLFDHVSVYFLQKGLSEQEAKEFYDLQNSTSWTKKGSDKPSSWKTAANEWIWQNRYRQS